MKYLTFIMALFLLVSCSSSHQAYKIPVYAWLSGPGEAADDEIKNQFSDLFDKGIDGLMYNGGQNPETYRRVGRIAKETGLEFYAWIPTLMQGKNPKIDSSWYAVNGKGESAFDKPAYVNYYKFLCPNRSEVYHFLSKLYTSVAAVDEVDGIHLDYIRFPDVILARGLWDKYGLVMDREYPQYDYCYCDHCVNDFKHKTGIDIKSVEDPSQIQEWKQYRYDLITDLVNLLADDIHAMGKKINAAVFPGPHSVAKKIVRQEWDKWNLDAFYPMHYNDFYLEGPEWVGAMTKEGVEALEGKAPLYSGLFICPNPEKKSEEKDPENQGLLPDEISSAIRASMENGAAGICLFTPGRMTDAHWKEFHKAIRINLSDK
ncbi:MAG: hypothetical protein JW755_13470 [Candidatus Aminicenantes bacterium]|nr:hypothetical protein [Candidatus Aminicenantes bacterium]